MRCAVGIFVLVCATFAVTRGEAVRRDLELRGVYWQVLPADVRAVKIDTKGRAWFEVDGSESVEQIKAQVTGVRLRHRDQSRLAWLEGVFHDGSTGNPWRVPMSESTAHASAAFR